MSKLRMPLACFLAAAAAASPTFADETSPAVDDAVIEAQRAALAASTSGAGFGPQSPRDLETLGGANSNGFATAPASSEMNLCNIHFHEGAEHRGGEFTTYAGNGDGEGHGTGYLFDGELSAAERAPYECPICGGDHGTLEPGDTIEVHYVHTTATVEPGPTLGACLNDNTFNPQLRVEAQVMVLVNDPNAADFGELAELGMVNGRHQAINIPTDTGTPITYEGSTTGPSYNEEGSPIQVSWSVRPEVIRVNIATLESWMEDNPFNEDYAHGVRNLVVNPDLLAPIGG